MLLGKSNGSFSANKLHSKEKGRSDISPRPEKLSHELVAIVVVVIPIAIGMPAVAVFVPPAVPFVPAALPRLVQFVPRMIRLLAVPSVVLLGFVQFVVRLGDPTLATAVVIRKCTRRSGESQHAGKQCGGEHRLCEKPIPSRLKLHILSVLPYSRWLGSRQLLSYKTPQRRECSKARTTP